MPDNLLRAADATDAPAISAQNISKSFGSINALTDISLTGVSGAVHAITGENGAGKSTLMKVFAGVLHPTSGSIHINGAPVRFRTPRDARAAGVSTVFQEFTLLPNLTVAENIHLGREPRKLFALDRARMAQTVAPILERLGFERDPRTMASDLSVGEQQLVEIAKGLSSDAQIFIFDEPTAALNRPEVDRLESVIQDLKRAGKCIFYISHRLEEIFHLSETTTVLKDGTLVASLPTRDLDERSLVNLMVGRPIERLFPERHARTQGGTMLQGHGLRPEPGCPAVDITVAKGEIVGLAGLEGQGQREILRALAGVLPGAEGKIQKFGSADQPAELPAGAGVEAARALGIGFIPGDRKGEGLYLNRPVSENIALGALQGHRLLGSARVERERLSDLAGKLNLRLSALDAPCGSLSGGNQQKVMLARFLIAHCDTLLIEEPTRGVDIGAKAEIYSLLRDFADHGGAVIMTSSELPELLGLCDRILVVNGARVVASLDAAHASEASILGHALQPVPHKPAKVAAE